MLRRFGVKVYFGDATRPDLLHAAGIDRAKLLVIAIDGKDQITELVHYVHTNYPDVHIMARAVDRNHVYDLWHAGCRDIIRETYDSSVRMGRSAFEALGVEKGHADQMAEAFSAVDRQGMIDVADAYDPDIPTTENQAYIDRVLELAGPRLEELSAKMRGIRGLDDPPS
jgi:CPA2 family monovalent cation:H+ antiporter-2